MGQILLVLAKVLNLLQCDRHSTLAQSDTLLVVDVVDAPEE